jgi:hypothetical protein
MKKDSAKRAERRGSEMEKNPPEQPVHLSGAKTEGFCKEWREEPYVHPTETSYPHLVSCRSCLEYMKQQFRSWKGSKLHT